MKAIPAPHQKSSWAIRSVILKQRYHFRTGFQPVQIIRPSLHHLPPFRQVLGEIISSADRIALGMRKLTFDRLMIPALFVQQR